MLSVQLEGIEEARRSFGSKIVDRAARLSINESARTGRKEAGKEIRARWNLKARKVNSELRNIQFATGGDLTAVIQAKGRPISLIHYGAKQLGVSRLWSNLLGTRRGYVHNKSISLSKDGLVSKNLSNRQIKAGKRGVEVNILRGEKTFLRGAFIAPTKNGYIGVFRREGRKRLPVRNLSTITIASMFAQEKVQEVTIDAVGGRFQLRFNHHIDRLMSK